MAEQRDVIIVGGGHNGLVTAFYLAKAGLKPLIIERRPQVGGAAITDEFYPGFKCSTLSHSAGPIRPDIVRDMRLEQHGLKLITPEVGVTALSPDGRALSLYNDGGKASAEIAKFSQKDATKYSEFGKALNKIGSVIGDVGSGLRIFRDRIAARRDRRPRNLRHGNGPMVGGKQPGIADSRSCRFPSGWVCDLCRGRCGSARAGHGLGRAKNGR
jgi:hypothetical protein